MLKPANKEELKKIIEKYAPEEMKNRIESKYVEESEI